MPSTPRNPNRAIARIPDPLSRKAGALRLRPHRWIARTWHVIWVAMVSLAAFFPRAGYAAEIYGLDRRASSTVVVSDYYGQTATVDPSDATLLQNNILISTTANGLISTNSTGSTALKNYLNAQYASGAGAACYGRSSQNAYDPLSQHLQWKLMLSHRSNPFR